MYEDFRNRLHKRYKHLSKWARRRKVYAWRLYHCDIPSYPFVIDIYEDALHFQVFDDEKREGELLERFIDDCAHLAVEVCQLSVDKLYCKVRRPQKGSAQYGKSGSKGESFVVREGACKFYVNLSTYLDTGLFLDHRLLRERIYGLAAEKDFLNLFGYTGSFSVNAALGGAHITETVDLSKTYLRAARENFRLNNIDPAKHSFVECDVFEYLQAARREGRRFDLILLDPPTFSNSKKMQRTLDVMRDSTELIAASYALLKPQGRLFFSTNRRRFRLDSDVLNNYCGKEISHDTIDEDFKAAAPHRAWEFLKEPR